jgi:hypothetical protein
MFALFLGNKRLTDFRLFKNYSDALAASSTVSRALNCDISIKLI